jgi:hypothetical protein
MRAIKEILILVAIAICLAAALASGQVLYDATHQTTPTQVEAEWTKLEGKLQNQELWSGTCEGQTWWIIPSKSIPEGVVVLEGNPDYGLRPVIHEVPGAFLSSCVKVQPVFIDDEYFVYKIWTR